MPKQWIEPHIYHALKAKAAAEAAGMQPLPGGVQGGSKSVTPLVGSKRQVGSISHSTNAQQPAGQKKQKIQPGQQHNPLAAGSNGAAAVAIVAAKDVPLAVKLGMSLEDIVKAKKDTEGGNSKSLAKVSRAVLRKRTKRSLCGMRAAPAFKGDQICSSRLGVGHFCRNSRWLLKTMYKRGAFKGNSHHTLCLRFSHSQEADKSFERTPETQSALHVMCSCDALYKLAKP